VIKSRAFLQIVYILIFSVAVQAEDIVNTLPGYDRSSMWAVTGPQSSYGDIDLGWRFCNNSIPHFLTIVELPLNTFLIGYGHIADIMIFSDIIMPGEIGPMPDQMLESVTINTVPYDNPAICAALFSGSTILDPNTYYWVVLSAPGTEYLRWNQDEFTAGWSLAAYRKNFSAWQRTYIGQHAGAMRVVGEPAPECKVEFDDFARFATHWLESGCNADNSWCSGADIERSGSVDFLDLALLVENWLTGCQN
jgi:hypothetical protein